MTVCVRPGKPNGAASGFFSGMLREPLAGQRSTVPVAPSTPVALASPASTVRGLLCAAETSDSAWGLRTAINLPSLQTTVGDMAAALERVAGPQTTALLDWVPDPAIERIVAGWPANLQFPRATALGLVADESVDALIRQYIADNPQAIARA
jgi:nucleoside-diphosphate-sugar epimerase